ncbi:MAG: hypothetical protein JWQ79_4120 [Mucilaginibacter sp.]|nr:hypothetical protein [Mucilaginibacter sp.]
MNKAVWLVVDGYSSGALYPLEIKKSGGAVYHLQSSTDIHSGALRASFNQDEYSGNFVFDEDLVALNAWVSNIDELQFVVAGCETGVYLADYLSETFGLPSNGTLKSAARRDKYKMVQALQAKNLRAAKTEQINSLYELDRFIEVVGFPVVIKPAQSASSDNVYICSMIDEAREAFVKIHGTKNSLGLMNEAVLAQELLRGQQYVVNTVSSAGCHSVVEVWQDNRIGTGNAYIYDHERLLSDQADYGHLLSYCYDVLDALDIRYGPCHIELMVEGTVPTLIEVGARPAGGIQRDVMESVQGFTHVSTSVQAYLNDGMKISVREVDFMDEVLAVALISSVAGRVVGYRNLDAIYGLPSYKVLVGLPDIGQAVLVTRDIPSQPGLLMLSHPSKCQVERDLACFRELEKKGIILIE